MTTSNTNTIKLHRVVKAPPERVYRAFLDPSAIAKWLPPNGFTCQVHHLEATVGGTYKMSFTNFSTGNSHSFWWRVSGTEAERTHPPHRQIRRSESAGRDNNDGHLETGVCRH